MIVFKMYRFYLQSSVYYFSKFIPDYVFVTIVAPILDVKVISPINVQISFDHVLAVLITDSATDISLIEELRNKVIVILVNVVTHIHWRKPFSMRPDISMLISLICHSPHKAVNVYVHSLSLIHRVVQFEVDCVNRRIGFILPSKH